ncbi:DnaJ domain-containing protein [Adhaeribacter soli]|uniref:DnaJ domain-containing protein n=1 Tax=Adhaeribacter soli TaxID=2607655 RepID=A0A5N1INV4_9BACT|nr:DnaJ domain-containing protein [Adhaeribacter soli]KAA9331742.1 DnaJ domain-containing protein [Adhaeribacter soli]
MQLNYYSVLGLKRTATTPEIKAAYKKLAVQYHPDKHRGDVSYEEKFKQVSEAYQVLANPQKRRIYDLKLDYAAQQQRTQQYNQQAYQAARQRRPASVHERHYRPIPKRRFSKRDWQITVGFLVAIILFSLVVKTVMDFVTAQNRFRNATTFMEQQQWSSAHSLLSEAIDFEPRFSEAYQKRGFINQNVYKDYRAAIEDYNMAIRLNETPLAETYFNRGQCHVQLRNYQQAEADFSTAIDYDHNFRRAYLYRGELRLLELNAWSGAISDLTDYLKKPLEEKEKNKALLYRGFGFYLTDKYDLAIKDYTTALKTDTKNGRLYYLLGKAEYSLDQHAKACRHFTLAYNLGYEPAILDWESLCAR